VNFVHMANGRHDVLPRNDVRSMSKVHGSFASLKDDKGLRVWMETETVLEVPAKSKARRCAQDS